MHCTHCGLWELAQGDLVCGWCGTSHLRYRVSLDPAEIAAEDYPPPVALRIYNESPVGVLTLEHIEAGAPWITLLPDQPLPHVLAPGTHCRFFLDVDTFSAGARTEASIAVSASYAAEPQIARLSLRQPVPSAA